MRQTPHGTTVTDALAAYTLRQVAVAALVAVLATVGLVAVVAQPAVLVGVVAVALAVRLRRVVTVPVARVHRRLTVDRQPATK